MSDDEMVAWVDENEQLIKVIPLSLANSSPHYLHSEVAILLYDQLGRVLLQKRAATKKVMPSIWICSAAGHITYGESTAIAAHRELQEEIGFDTQLTEVTKILNTLQSERHIAHWFLGNYTNGKIALDPREASEYVWIGEKECDRFLAMNEVAPITVQIARRFWSGEWSDLLK